MTVMQQQDIEMIKKLPDDKVYYVVNILKSIDELTSETQTEELTKSQKAYQNFQRFCKSSSTDRDYKKDLYAALEEQFS